MADAETQPEHSEVETQLPSADETADAPDLALEATEYPSDRVASLDSRPARAVVRQLGTEHGRYQLLEEVGRGAMGIVYAAFDTRLDRRVALKLLAPGVDTSRVLEEGRALARLRSPNVVAIYDAGEREGQVFLAMEFIKGKPLGDWVADNRDVDRIVRAFRDAAMGLADAHAAGLIHRDFKPDNVMVTDTGRVVVMDFGLAIASEDQGAKLGAGTPAYMSPEQVRREPLTKASDQFSFFVALTEAVEGQRPFTGATLAELALAISQARIDASTFRSTPRWLRSIVETGLSGDAASRHKSMQRVAKLLDRGLARRRRIGIVAVGACALTTSIGYAAFKPTAERQCIRRLDSRYNLDALQEVTEPAFRATFDESFDSEWAATEPGFLSFEEAWRNHYAAACRAVHDRDAPLERNVFRARTDCLQSQFTFVQTLAESAEGSDAEGLYAIRAASRELPEPGSCLAAVPRATEADGADRYVVSAAGQALARADGLWKANRYEEALELLERATPSVDKTRTPRTSAELHLKQSRILADLNRNDAAKEQQGRAIAAASRSGDVSLMVDTWAARVLHEGQLTADPERIDALLETLRVLDPGKNGDDRSHTIYLLAEGDQRRLAGDYDDALEWYGRAEDLVGRLPRQLKGQVFSRTAIALAQRGESARARPYFEKVWKLDRDGWGPGHPRTLVSRLNLAKVLALAGGDTERSDRHLEAILAYPDFPNRAGALVALARNRGEALEFAKAKELLEEAIPLLIEQFGELSPKLTPARLELFNALRNLGEFKAAHVQATQLVAIARAGGTKATPKTGFAFTALGDSCVDLGQFEQAKEHYETALEIRREYGAANSHIGRTLSGLATAYLLLGDLERAQSTSAEAIALLPHTASPEARARAWMTFARSLPAGEMRSRAAYNAMRLFEQAQERTATEAYALMFP